MSHEIDSMMYVKETPWHKLGKYVGDKNLTAAQAIKEAGLDWEVAKVASQFTLADGQTRRGEGFQIVRMDRKKALGSVGSVYEPLQNSQAFEFMDAVIGSGRAAYHTAGALCEGRKIWILVDLKNEAEVVLGDPVQSFLLLSNSHDGTTSIEIGLTSVRVVCKNTLNQALNNRERGKFLTFRHTKTFKAKAQEVTEALEAVSEKFTQFIKDGKVLAMKQITAKELDDFLIRLEFQRANEREEGFKALVSEYKQSRKYREMVWAFENSPGNKKTAAAGTLWAAVNAVTYQVDHMAATRKTDHIHSNEEARLNSAWFNGGALKKDRAFSLALEMAGKV